MRPRRAALEPEPGRAISLLRASAGALALLALCAAPLRAQTPAPAPAAQAAAPGGPEAPPAQDSVPVGEITQRAQLLADELRALESSLADRGAHQQLESDLVRYAERIEPELPRVSAELLQAPSLATLSQLEVEWRGYERQLATRQERLHKLITSLEQQSDELRASRELWQRTRTRAREREVPPAILDAIKAALADSKRGAAALEGALNDALVLQSQFADLHGSVQLTLASIEDARARVLDNLLVRDVPPLWQVDLAGELGDWSDWRIGDYLKALRSESVRYVAQHQDAVAVHLLVLGLLIWALRRTRGALRAGEADEDPEAPEAGARLATRHPLAAATVLALLATPLLHDDAPRALLSAARLLFVVPTAIVLRPLLGEAYRAPLYLLVGFFVVDRLREMMTGAVAPDRVVFFAEMVALAIVLAALLRPDRLQRLPASARGNRWLSALGVWIRFSALAAAVAALASLAGYTRFANLLGGGVLGSGYAALVFFALVRIAEGLAAAVFGGQVLAPVRMVDHHRALLLRRTRRLLRGVGIAAWLLAVTQLLAVRAPLARGLRALLGASIGYGAFEFTLGGVLAFALTLVGAWLVARAVHFVLDEEIFPRVSLARGVPFALSTLVRYAILLVGFLVALSALGFDLDRITILLGAFGVGIGFGLQNVVNNFVSGLILLFERPVKVGDLVELAGVEGTVQRIGIRASTVRTFDGAEVIVPNGSLLSDRVVNWTLSDRTRRLVLPVGVAYGSDLARVMQLLQQVAEAQPGVCAYPKPLVAFMGFGESALDFQLRVWTEDLDTLIEVRSQLGLAIHAALRDAGIDIPYPQRSLHLASVDAAAAAALRGPGGA